MQKEITPQQALQKKYPEQIILVSCCHQSGKANLIPLGWSMQTSFKPPMVAISVGKTRYSHYLIKESQDFVIGFPGIDITASSTIRLPSRIRYNLDGVSGQNVLIHPDNKYKCMR